MNILEQTEALKDLPDAALIKEMQMPTGMAAPIFITNELKRRQRIRSDFQRREAADQPTVAEEVVTAAGVPQQGIMQMARNMAPKTNMGQNTGMADMMPKQPTMGMSDGGVVKMQSGGTVEEQIQKILEEQRENPVSITNTFKAAMIERTLDGNFGKTAKIQAARAAIAGEYGLEVQRQVLTEALAGEYGDEIKEGAKRAKGVLEQSGLRGFEPTDTQLAPTAATAETVVSPSRGFEPTSSQLASTAATAEKVVSPSRGFEPTASQLAPTASMAETVKPEFESGILKSGIRGFEPTDSLLAPTAANAKTIFPPSMMTMPAMRDPAVIDPTTGQPYDVLGSMRQQAEQARQAEAQAEFVRSLSTPDELMVPFDSTKDLFDPQGLNQQREDRDRALTSEIAASGREDELSTFPIQTFQQNQPQTQELLLPTAQPTGRQSLDGRMVSTVGPTAAEIERAQKVLEMNPGVTASDAELELLGSRLNFLNRDPEEDSELGLNRPKVANQFTELGATKQTIDGEEFFVLPTGMVYDSNGKLVQGGKAMQAINSAQIGGEDFSKSPLGEIPFGSYDVDAAGDVIPDSFKKASVDIGGLRTPNIIKEPASGLAGFLGVEEGSAPVTDVTSAIRPNIKTGTGFTGTTIAGDPRIAAGVVGETVKKDKKEDKKEDKAAKEQAAKEQAAAEVNKLIADSKKALAEQTKTAATAAGSVESRIADLMAKRQKSAEQDKWLALAKTGVIMSSGDPADLRRAGEVGIKSLQTARAQKDKFDADMLGLQARIDAYKARIAAAGSKGALTTNQLLTQGLKFIEEGREAIFNAGENADAVTRGQQLVDYGEALLRQAGLGGSSSGGAKPVNIS